MYCEKCGNKIEEGDKFCQKCGVGVGAGNSKNMAVEKSNKGVKIEDNEVVLKVKPTFKFWYVNLGIFIFLFAVVIIAIAISASPILDSTERNNIAMWVTLGSLFLALVPAWFIKKQYQAFEYNFYKTKLIYHDSFINITEKEIKYRYIREVQMVQTFVQRWFNIGRIQMFTNAESGMGNGITIVSVLNPKQVYSEIKKVIDGGN